MFEIAVDPVFPPKNPPRQDGRPNDFELIYCEHGSAYSRRPVNVRTPFAKSPYPIAELDPSTQIINFISQPDAKASVIESEISSPVRVQSASVEPRSLNQARRQSLSLESIVKSLQSPLHFRSMLDTQFISMQVNVVISTLINWEHLNPKDVELACRALVAISATPAVFILAEQRNILNISKLLSNREVKTEIKLATVSYNA